MNSLGSNYLQCAVQYHQGFRHPSKSCWQCQMSSSALTSTYRYFITPFECWFWEPPAICLGWTNLRQSWIAYARQPELKNWSKGASRAHNFLGWLPKAPLDLKVCSNITSDSRIQDNNSGGGDLKIT